MQRPNPTNGEIYHIYNRGVEKRRVFLNDEDRFRFIHDLFEFNDVEPAPNLAYHIGHKQSKEVGLPKVGRKKRRLIVELMAFCLMHNHYHLIVRQKIDNGITEFMRKLGTGYTNYFNQKYQRVGPLFQGKYKIVHLITEAHFIHLPYYVHLNPLDFITPSWRERKIENYKETISFLKKYRWSSLPDYLGEANFPSVTQRDFLMHFFDGPKNYQKSIFGWLKHLNTETVDGVKIEL